MSADEALSPVEAWQVELAREASAGRGIDALPRILTAIKDYYAADKDENNLLDAIQQMSECAHRHLREYNSTTIETIFNGVFPPNNHANHALDAIALNHDAEAEVQRAARSPLVQYERERKGTAERLGMRPSALDAAVKAVATRPQDTHGQGRKPSIAEIEPWHESVSLAEVLRETTKEYVRYLIMPDGGAEEMALWSFMTHCFDCFAIIPRLAVTAADKECAKSLLLRILKCTSARAVIMTNANIAPLFRVISSHRPTILLDEADNYIHENPQLLALLNDGYAAGGCVWRCEGEGNDVREFDVFAPVAVAMIERPPATLLSRSIEIRMKRKKPGEKTENFRGDRANTALHNLQRKFARVARDHAYELRNADPDIGNLFNRDADNWRPIFAIANLAGAEWPQLVRKIADAAVAAKAEQSILEKLLTDIRWVFDGCPDSDTKKTALERIFSATLVDHLTKIEGRPWAEWKNGKPLTQNALARLLAKHGIIPATIRIGDSTGKGYYRSAFNDVFDRHLPPQTVTASQHNNHGRCDGLQNVTPQKLVGLQKTSKLNSDGHCDAVTVVLPDTAIDHKCTQCGEDGDVLETYVGMPNPIWLHRGKCTEEWRAARDQLDIRNQPFYRPAP